MAADNIISIGIDPTDINSLKDAAKSIDEIGKKLNLTKPQLKTFQLGVEGAIKNLAKLKVSEPFSKLALDTKKATEAITLLNQVTAKNQKLMTKTLSPSDGFMSRIRGAKALLLIEQKQNAELEKQAAIVAKLATACGKGSNANKQAAANLRTMQAQTKELEKSLSVQKQISMLRSAGITDVSPNARAFNTWAKTVDAAGTSTKNLTNSQKDLDTTTKKVAGSTKQAQIAMAGMARSVGVATLSYSALLPLMAGMAAGASIKKVYEIGAAFEYTTTYIDALSGSIEALSAQDIQSSLLDFEGLRKGPQELTAGMKEFAKAGVEASESLGQIAEMSKFATIAELDLASANKLVIGQSKAFGIEFTASANMIAAAALSSATDIQELGTALSYTTELATVTGTTFDEVATAMAVMANAGIRGCYDRETDVLTKDGWKKWEDVTYDDEFATYNEETGELEYQEPDRLVRYHHSGPMYKVCNKGIDLCVTPDHRMYVKKRGEKEYEILTAEEISGKAVRYKTGGIGWEGESSNVITLPGFSQHRGSWVKEVASTDINSELWATFLGWYIAEGHCNLYKGSYRVVITQKKPNHLKKMTEVFDALPWKYNRCESTGQFTFCNEQLFRALKPLGNVYKKHIPQYAKNWGRSLLESLYQALLEGDGDSEKKYYTSSVALRDDVQEIALKLGYATLYRKEMSVGDTATFSDGRQIVARADGWKVSVTDKRTEPWYTPDAYRGAHGERVVKGSAYEHFEGWIDYDDEVFCAEVPNGLLIVRRKGRAIVSGNSKAGTAIRTSMLKMATPTEKLKKQFDALGISWTAFSDNGKIKSMRTMFTELERVTKALPDTQRVAILKDLFGLRALKGGANLLRAQGEEWDNLNQKIRDAADGGSFVNETYEKLADTTTARWEKLGVEIEKTFIRAFASEDVNSAIENMTDMIASPAFGKGITDAVSGLSEIVGLLSSLGTVVVEVSGQIESAKGWREFFDLLTTADLGKKINSAEGAASSYVEGEGEELSWFGKLLQKDLEMLKALKGMKDDFISSDSGWDPVYGLATPTQNIEADQQKIKLPAFNTQEHTDAVNLHYAEMASAAKEGVELVTAASELEIAEQSSVSTEMRAVRKMSLEDLKKYFSERVAMIQEARAQLGEFNDMQDPWMKEAAVGEAMKANAKIRNDLQAQAMKDPAIDFAIGLAKAEESANAILEERLVLRAKQAEALEYLKLESMPDMSIDFLKGKEGANERSLTMIESMRSAAVDLSQTIGDIKFDTALVGLSEFDSEMKRIQREAQTYADDMNVGMDDSLVQEFIAAREKQVKANRDFELSEKGVEASLKAEKNLMDEVANAIKDYADARDSISASQELAVMDIELGKLQGVAKLQYEANKAMREFKLSEDWKKFSEVASLDEKNEKLRIQQGIIDATVLSVEKATEALIEQAKLSENAWKGFNAGILDAISNMKTLGELGYDLANNLLDTLGGGLKDSFSAIFRGEFDTIGDIWESTLDSMLTSVIDFAAEAAANMVIEASLDFVQESLGFDIKEMLGLGEANPMAPATFSGKGLMVDVGDGLSVGAGGYGAYGGFQGSDIAGSITKEELAWSIAEGVAPWAADLAQVDTSYAFDPTVSSGWSDQSADFANDFSDALGNVSQVTIAAIDKDLDNLMDSRNDLFGFRDDTLMDSARGTWETAKPYVGAASSAYGIYSGIQQGGVGGAFQTAGGVASLAGNSAVQELIPALADMSSTISTLSSGIGVAGGLYGAYQGVKEGNYVQAASGAYQAYQGATTLMPEISTAISEGFSSVGSYFATEAAAETGSLIVAETAAATGAGTAAGSGFSTFMAGGGGAMIGMAIKMGTDIYASETEDKFKYDSSYGGFEVAERGQDRGSALVYSMDNIMEDLAMSVEAGASAVNYVPDEMVQRANQHLEVLWTEFGEGMAGMALAVEPSLNSFDQYVQATTNAHLSTQELSWMMERATEASFGNIEAVQSLEYYMITLGQSTVEASVSAAGMISAMGEASTGMTAAGQIYYTTLAEMAAGTSNFDGTVRELQASLGMTDTSVSDLSGTLEGATGQLDSYGNVVTDVGGDASEAATYMEQFGSSVRGMSDEAIAAANAFNSIVMAVPQGISQYSAGAQENYNKDGAVYSYHANGGVMNRPTVFHVGGEAGSEAIMPLHAGPNTLKIMDDKLDALANRSQTTIVNIAGTEVSRTVEPMIDKFMVSRSNVPSDQRVAY